MKKSLLLIVSILLILVSYAEDKPDIYKISKDSAFKLLVESLNAKNSYCGTDDEKLIQPKSLDDYIYSIFGKVALDNDEYIANSTAFNATFSSDNALISANYTHLMKKNKNVVWSVGGKAEADDGTYLLWNGSSKNFGIGVNGGFIFLANTNGIYYDLMDDNDDTTCTIIKKMRSEDNKLLLAKYYKMLKVDTIKLKEEIVLLEKEITEYKFMYDNMSKKDYEDLVANKKKLDKNLEEHREFMKYYNKKNWVDSVIIDDLAKFNKIILDSFSTGYHLRWWDIKGDLTNENKHALDWDNPEDGFVSLHSFMRGSIAATFNYFHTGKKTLYYLRGGLTIGNGYAYDLMKPEDVEFESVIAIVNNQVVTIKADDNKVFIEDTYDDLYFVAKIPYLGNMFIGKKKIFGLELSGSFGLMVGKDIKAPFDFKAGILFSPLDRDKKTNDGTIGIMIGMKKMDFTKLSAVNKKNVYFGVRVGLPLTKTMAKK